MYRILGSLVKRYNFQVFHYHFVNEFYAQGIPSNSAILNYSFICQDTETRRERKLSYFRKRIRLREWKPSQGRIFRDYIASYLFLSFSLFFFSGPQISRIKIEMKARVKRNRRTSRIINP